MRTIRTLAFATALAVTAGLGGCFGGGAEVRQDVSTVSQGQELSDLKRALDAGAVTQREYELLHHKILNR
jgi:hypothetical protein